MPPSNFDLTVYRAVGRIPIHRVATYATVARAIGCGSPRAIGQALRRNPFAPEVPCHRVIRADLRLGGFQGHRQGDPVAHKRTLLEREGIRFDAEGRLLDPAQLVTANDLATPDGGVTPV